jgi:hypothetical protein
VFISPLARIQGFGDIVTDIAALYAYTSALTHWRTIMKKNVGTVDRVIRGIAGIAAIAAFALNMVTGTMGIVALVVGAVLLGTAVLSWCPPYALLGINTCSTKSE